MSATRVLESPVGPLTLLVHEGALRSVLFDQHRHGPRAVAPTPATGADQRVLAESVRQLAAYFAGTLRAFDLPLAQQGTPFQQRVWTALCAIPYGERRSYAALAREVGSPAAVRAVGGANGRNPVSIVVPCHRVIGSDGSLTGYGGGEDRKRWLLAHEDRLRTFRLEAT